MEIKATLIDPDALGELAKEEEKPLNQLVQELRESNETLAAYLEKHPFAKQLLPSSELETLPLAVFTQNQNIQVILQTLEQFTFSPALMAKHITSWKWKLEDPDNFHWLCSKVVLNTLLILPLAYAAKEAWSILLERHVSISYRSLMKQIFITSLLSAGVENIVARYLKSLDSHEGNQ